MAAIFACSLVRAPSCRKRFVYIRVPASALLYHHHHTYIYNRRFVRPFSGFPSTCWCRGLHNHHYHQRQQKAPSASSSGSREREGKKLLPSPPVCRRLKSHEMTGGRHRNHGSFNSAEKKISSQIERGFTQRKRRAARNLQVPPCNLVQIERERGE